MHFRLSILLVAALMLTSCGAKKRRLSYKKPAAPPVRVQPKPKPVKAKAPVKKIPRQPSTGRTIRSTQDYIKTFSEIAVQQMRDYNIPASITLAQGILESSSGKSRLSVVGNNHFGIKCHGWEGDKIYHDDDSAQECFRKYQNAATSYKDHSEFLTTRQRYASLFDLEIKDYQGWAKGLRAAGYATDRQYPQKLINIIERYELYLFDEDLAVEASVEKKQADASLNTLQTRTHRVVKGDTLYSLSKRYNTTVEAIKLKNNMSSNDLAIGFELVIP